MPGDAYLRWTKRKVSEDVDEEQIQRHGKLHVDEDGGIFFQLGLRSYYVDMDVFKECGKVVQQRERTLSGLLYACKHWYDRKP